MYWYILAALIAVILVAVFGKRLKQSINGAKPSTSGFTSAFSGPSAPTTLCDAPNCVRCNRNQTVVATARTTYETRFGDNAQTTRIGTAIDGFGGYMLSVAHLESRPLWLGHMRKSAHGRLIGDIGRIPLDWRAIYEEYETMAKSSAGWSHNCAADGRKRWRVLSLVNQGRQMECNLNRMPLTRAMLESLDCLMTDTSLAHVFFSVLPPDTQIVTHCGPTNARLRCHLPLQVPRLNTDCTLKVDDSVVHWHQGECVLFDDSRPHSVNYSALPDDTKIAEDKQDRVVLIMDMWHPGLTAEERKAIQTCFPASK